MQAHWQKVDGIAMRWEEAGEGQPVVFLHGIPTSPRLWRHVIPQINDARCLAWELVGYGGSILAGEDRDIGLSSQAEYLRRWMEELDLPPPVLVGHDLGGGIAQILAAEHPQRVRALVLINSVSYDSWPIRPIRMLRGLGGWADRMPDALVRALLQRLLRQGHETQTGAEAAFAEHWPAYQQHGSGPALARQVRSLRTQETVAVADQLRRIGRPARVIWGAADKFQRVGYGYRLANDLAAPIERIERGRHFVPEDHPDRVAGVINQLLRGLI